VNIIATFNLNEVDENKKGPKEMASTFKIRYLTKTPVKRKYVLLYKEKELYS
jgi:hypothetical protein